MAHDVARAIVSEADYQLTEEKERSGCGCVINLPEFHLEYSFVFYPGLDIIKLTNDEVLMNGPPDVVVQMMSSRILKSFSRIYTSKFLNKRVADAARLTNPDLTRIQCQLEIKNTAAGNINYDFSISPTTIEEDLTINIGNIIKAVRMGKKIGA